jgi:hypothetical protein
MFRCFIFVAGWGLLDEDAELITLNLQQVPVPYIRNFFKK